MSSKQQKNNAFRVPPLSPTATGQGIKAAGLKNEIWAEFLEQSLHIPDLILPEPLLRTNIPHQDLPAFDLPSLCFGDPKNGTAVGRLVQSAVEFGCSQVINHGMLLEIIVRAEEECDRLFELPLGKKQIVCRSDDIHFRFEDIAGDAVENTRVHETFWVDQNEDLMEETLRHLWPKGYKNFRLATDLDGSDLIIIEPPQNARSSFQIFVKMPKGNTIVIWTYDSDRVSDLKNNVAEQIGYPTEK